MRVQKKATSGLPGPKRSAQPVQAPRITWLMAPAIRFEKLLRKGVKGPLGRRFARPSAN